MSDDVPSTRSGTQGAVSSPQGSYDFLRRAFFDEDDLLGARWWNESFAASVTSAPPAGDATRRGLFQTLAIAGLVGAAYLSVRLLRDDEPSEMDALALQGQHGWNVGHPQASLVLPGARVLDASGSRDWQSHLGDLAKVLAPPAHLLPFNVPTLFQALGDPSGASLRTAMFPMHTPEMQAAFDRAASLRELTGRPEAPPNLGLIIDLPGPQAVAVAAALAPRFAPVFTFDNWPHPVGVVPAHQTLAAALHYLPAFTEAKSVRQEPAPPVFVLDANRLAPYRDQSDEFDNRYVARLPSPRALESAGVRRLLYVRPDTNNLTELDDLNAEFVAYERAGIDVRAVALGELATSDLTPGERPGTAAAATSSSSSGHSYYYGGHPHYHALFWHSYGWNTGVARLPAPPPPPARRALPRSPSYRPTFRPTMFATRAVGGLGGVGLHKPSGFGRVSVRTNRQGAVTSVGRARSASGRSGSFGRSRGSSFSG